MRTESHIRFLRRANPHTAQQEDQPFHENRTNKLNAPTNSTSSSDLTAAFSDGRQLHAPTRLAQKPPGHKPADSPTRRPTAVRAELTFYLLLRPRTVLTQKEDLATNLQTAQRDDHGSVRIESHICLLRRSTASPNNTSRSNNKEDLATYPQTAQRDDQRLRENRVSHLPSPTAANFTNRSRIKEDLATNLQTANHCMEPHQQTRHRHTHFIRQR
jgi:hypothetical protein